MRKLIAILPIIFLLQSCGQHTRDKYIENPFNNDANEARLRELESKVFDIEVRTNSNIESLVLLTNLLNDMDIQNTNSLIQIMSRIEDLESDTNTLFDNMLELRGHSITKIIDPCGDSDGYDEVLLKIGSGQVLAYFENGGSRHLAVISTGSYSTSDGTNCRFEVSSEGAVLHTVGDVIISD